MLSSLCESMDSMMKYFAAFCNLVISVELGKEGTDLNDLGAESDHVCCFAQTHKEHMKRTANNFVVACPLAGMSRRTPLENMIDKFTQTYGQAMYDRKAMRAVQKSVHIFMGDMENPAVVHQTVIEGVEREETHRLFDMLFEPPRPKSTPTFEASPFAGDDEQDIRLSQSLPHHASLKHLDNFAAAVDLETIALPGCVTIRKIMFSPVRVGLEITGRALLLAFLGRFKVAAGPGLRSQALV